MNDLITVTGANIKNTDGSLNDTESGAVYA